MQQFAWQVPCCNRRQEPAAQITPHRSDRKSAQPPLAPTQDRQHRDSELLRQQPTTPQAQAGAQRSRQKHYRAPVNAPPQKADRRGRTPSSAMATAQADAGCVHRCTAWPPFRFALVVGLMQGTSTGATLRTNSDSVVLIDTQQECEKRRILKHGLAHNAGVSMVVGNPETRPWGAC